MSIRLFAEMKMKTEPKPHYRIRTGDLIVIDDMIHRVTETTGSFTSPSMLLEPAWSFETNRAASGIPQTYHPEGYLTKVVVTY